MKSYEHTLSDSLKTCLALAVAALAAMLLACTICAPQALAKQTVEMPEGWGVADDITRIHVNKLDAGTHEQLKGATMAIIERDSGKVIDEWVTDGTTHELEKVLNVNTVYILRELKAPDGYDKVEDVIFNVDEKEGVGLHILSSNADEAELTNGYLVTLYDQHENFVKTVTQTRGETRSVAPKTGDETPLGLVGALAGVAVVAIVVLQFAKRRMKN